MSMSVYGHQRNHQTWPSYGQQTCGKLSCMGGTTKHALLCPCICMVCLQTSTCASWRRPCRIMDSLVRVCAQRGRLWGSLNRCDTCVAAYSGVTHNSAESKVGGCCCGTGAG